MELIIGKQFAEKIIPLIDEAKNTIRVVVFDWRWYPNDPGNPVQLFNQAIVRAAKRGVKVDAIVTFEPLVKTLRDLGVNAKKLTSTNLLHTKLILIDDEIVVVGSHNFTAPAFTKNFEVSVFFTDTELGQNLINYFNQIWQL